MNYIEHDNYWRAYNPQLDDKILIKYGVTLYGGFINSYDRWVKVSKLRDEDNDVMVFFNCMYWGVNISNISGIIPAY